MPLLFYIDLFLLFFVFSSYSFYRALFNLLFILLPMCFHNIFSCFRIRVSLEAKCASER